MRERDEDLHLLDELRHPWSPSPSPTTLSMVAMRCPCGESRVSGEEMREREKSSFSFFFFLFFFIDSAEPAFLVEKSLFYLEAPPLLSFTLRPLPS